MNDKIISIKAQGKMSFGQGGDSKKINANKIKDID